MLSLRITLIVLYIESSMFWWGEKLIQTGTTLYRIVSERDGTSGSLNARRSFIGGINYQF